MNSNPILEEAWRAKDELAREAGGDIHAMCENARRWVQSHPHRGPLVRNAAELRERVAAAGSQRAVREQSPAYGERPSKS